MAEKHSNFADFGVPKLVYCLAWRVKSRSFVLHDPIPDALRAVLKVKAANLGVVIRGMSIFRRGVALLVEIPPDRTVAAVLWNLKGDSGRAVKEWFPQVEARVFWPWGRRSYVATVGKMNKAAIRECLRLPYRTAVSFPS